MRKNIARKCLCIALASAMMLGEAGTAMAASVENAADGRTAPQWRRRNRMMWRQPMSAYGMRELIRTQGP